MTKGWSYIIHCSCVVAGVPPVSIDSVLTSLWEGMPATCQYVCMSSFLVFFSFHVILFPMFELVLIEAARKKHCRNFHCCIRQTSSRTWVSTKGNLFTSCQKVIVKTAGRSFLCMPTRHCGTMVLLQMPLGSCHVQHTLLHILLACRFKWCLAFFSITMFYGWAVEHIFFFFSLSHPKVWRGGSLLFHCQPQLPLSREDHVVPGDQTLLPTHTYYSGRVSTWPTLCRLGGCQPG